VTGSVDLASDDKGKPCESAGRKTTGPWVATHIVHLRKAGLPRDVRDCPLCG